jgi:hypothetical protein
MHAGGELVRTGQFAISNFPSSHLSKLTFGSKIEGLSLQSSLGIRTKLGIWLTPAPQAFMSCSFDMAHFDDVETIVDLFGPFSRDSPVPNTVYVSNLLEWLGRMGNEKTSDLKQMPYKYGA